MTLIKTDPERAGEAYRPANSSEGHAFHLRFCCRCLHEFRQPQPCEIAGRTFFFAIDSLHYPKEWQYDDMGNPVCTAFEQHPEAGKL